MLLWHKTALRPAFRPPLLVRSHLALLPFASIRCARQRIRTAAALNYHIYPYEYDDLYDEDADEASWKRQELFDSDFGLPGTLADEGDTGKERAKRAERYMIRQQGFMKAHLLSDVNTAEWDSRHNPSDRRVSGREDRSDEQKDFWLCCRDVLAFNLQ